MKSDWAVFRRLWTYLGPYKWRIGGGLFSGIVLAAFGPGITFGMKRVLTALEARSKDALLEAFLFIALLFLADMFFRFFRNYLLKSAGELSVSKMREQTVEALMNAPVHFFEKQAAGQLTSRILFDSTQIPGAMEGLGYYITSPLTLLGLVAVAIYQDWRMTVIIFVVAPFVAWIFKVIGGSVSRNSQRTQEAMGEISVALSELTQGVKTIKVFGGEKAFLASFRARNMAVLRGILKMTWVQELASPITELVMAAVGCGVLLYLGFQVVRGEQSIADLGQMVTAFGLLQEPIRRLTGVHTRVMQGIAACRRLFEVMDEPAEDVPSSSVSTHVLPKDVAVEFRHVTFAYGERTVLSDANFTVAAKEWVGIRGPSGSGKTTVAHLICGFYPGFVGTIQMNQKSLKDYSLRELRSLISLVSQDVFLFHDTIFNNILLGRPGATEAEVLAAANSAYADEFIRRQPQGYNTVVGDRGCKLSGGERQRVSIARALLKNAPLIILDEATSALDRQSEGAVQKALDVLMKDRTVLIIAHKESSLSRAHRVLDMSEGRIA